MSNSTTAANTAQNIVIFPSAKPSGALLIGQIVSYQDRANPHQKAVVIDDANPHQQNCIFEDGHRAQVSRSYCDGSCGWQMHQQVLTAEQIAAFLEKASATLDNRIATVKAEKEAAATAKAEMSLKLLAKYPMLEREGGKKSGRVLAAANIRRLLKLNFSGMKFEVTSKSYSGGNSVDIYWTNGPTTDEVEKFTSQFQGGRFDGMEDIYRHEASAWTDLFGEAKYVHASRNVTDDRLREIADEMGYAGVPVVHGDIAGQNFETNRVFRLRWYGRSFYGQPALSAAAVHAPILCW